MEIWHEGPGECCHFRKHWGKPLSQRISQGILRKDNTDNTLNDLPYTTAQRVSDKQEELEAKELLEKYDLIVITETWWNDTHN